MRDSPSLSPARFGQELCPFIQYLAAGFADSHFFAVGQRFASDAPRFIAIGADNHHIREGDLPLPLDDSPLRIRLIRAGVLLEEVELLNDNRPLVGEDMQHLPLFPFFLARDHANMVAFSNLGPQQRGFSHHSDPYKTSGASEIIFVNFFQRSSLATGPKIRVPIGSPCALIKTAAFRSNLI